MIRFAWLQTRTQTVATALALAAFAVLAAITGVHLSHVYNTLVTNCQTGCGLATARFLTHGHFLTLVFPLVATLAAPIIGVFWGAPLLTREFEAGTYRLAWTQTISRSRWLVTKLAIVGFAAIVAAGILSLTITWWYRVLDHVNANQYVVFDQRGIAPIGYAAFAFAAGALIGAIIRRTLPAMATTIAVYVFARVAVTQWARPHLLSPIHKTMSLLSSSQFGLTSVNGSAPILVAQGAAPTNSWLLSSHLITNSGQVATSGQLADFVQQQCPKIAAPPPLPTSGRSVAHAGNPAAFHACITKAAQTYHLAVSYLPADRYWALQWIETGIFCALTLIAAAACYWWVTRRAN